MNKRVLLTVSAVIAAAVLLIIGVTTAFFTDVEIKDNVITIGKVSIELDEGSFEPTQTYAVEPGSRVEKAPKLKNTGNKDEFVFMRITVPKDSVTLLNESGADKGKPKGERSVQQLFRLLANTRTPPAQDNVAAVTRPTGRDVDISYHSAQAAGSTVDGWELLKVEENTGYDEYVFGHNKLMKPNDETQTLFDAVQLKSFIDGETTGEKEIGVYCYGIQAEYLKTDVPLNLSAANFTATELNKIYTIVENKANQ